MNWRSIKDIFLKHINNNSFSLATTKDICKNLFWIKFNEQGRSKITEYINKTNLKNPTPEGIIDFLKFLDNKISIFGSEIKEIETQRAKKMSQFKQESKYINDYLVRLSVSHFTIDVTDGKEGLKIIYKNGKQKKGIKNSLSEGEKTTLAFAYFLSKYKFEVKDNPQVNESDCIIIIDDPVSSLDENRLYSTALMIRDNLLPKAKDREQTEWNGCKPGLSG